MLRKTIITAAMTATLLALGACNTVKGLGEDISSVGRAGEEAIN
ncbi:entericidin A/B family lipoprotein [Croceicoccus marinus]|jgi:entericidin B|uniref:Entericidin A/B family lipoprotein n=1 Tax=Croceicoccus marinus TaxID=450378 RepID=A0A7G6VUA4_9SPHN|nr:entericidin A/B family lipoprotein [Croceicoccus marinus]QNE05319.1 entericidin A/B family lipoprotein [Croceicoccus marinus]